MTEIPVDYILVVSSMLRCLSEQLDRNLLDYFQPILQPLSVIIQNLTSGPDELIHNTIWFLVNFTDTEDKAVELVMDNMSIVEVLINLIESHKLMTS